MPQIGDDQAGVQTIESGPLPLVTLKVIGNGVEGSYNIGYLAASTGDTVTEYHMYVRTRDSVNMTAEAGMYTYDRQHNDQDYNGVPIALFNNSIENLSPTVSKTAGWKAKTGLSYELDNGVDYCMCAGGNSGDSLIFYGDEIWAVSIDTGTLNLQTPWVHNNFNQAFWPSMYFVYEEGAEEGAVPQRMLMGIGQ